MLDINIPCVIMKPEYFNDDKSFDLALEWLQENIKGKWERFGGFFTFSNNDDAVLFKLSWG